MATGQTKNITQNVPVSFVDIEDDHNVVKPPTQRRSAGRRTARPSCISDNWDIWQVPVGRRRRRQPDGQRHEGPDPLPAPPAARAARRSRRRHRSVEAAVLRASTASGRRRTASRGSTPASPASTNVLLGRRVVPAPAEGREGRRRSSTRARPPLEPADYYATDAEVRRTEAAHRHAAAGGGVPLDAGRAARGLHQRQGRQAAGRALPARQLREGQVVSDGRQLLRADVADGATRSRNPTANGFNRSVYTSNGYAVLMPDIAYKVNDPGHVGGVVHGAGGEGGDRDRASSMRRRSASPATRGAATRRRSWSRRPTSSPRRSPARR